MSDFLQELRRRKVFRVAAVYAVVAWVLIQVADTVLPALQMPQWTVSFVTVLFILGFPIALILAWAYEVTPGGIESDSGFQTSRDRAANNGHAVNYVILAVVLLVAGFQVADRFWGAAESTNPVIRQSSAVTRVSVKIPESEFFHSSRGDFDLSADGSFMVYRGSDEDGEPILWLKQWDQLQGRPLRNTEGATRPRISPDGNQIVMQGGRSEIRIVSIQGSISRTLVEGELASPDWSPDGTWIYFVNGENGISRIRSIGGDVETIVSPNKDNGESAFMYLDVLPNNQLVYTTTTDDGISMIQAADPQSGQTKDLTLGKYPVYSEEGFLLFQSVDEPSLLAASFDLTTMELTSSPIVIGENLLLVGGGAGNIGISDNGRLIYRTGDISGVQASPVWVDREGNESAIDPEWITRSEFGRGTPALSPGGDRMAIAIASGSAASSADIWIKYFDGPLSRITFDEESENLPGWFPDGESVIYSVFYGPGAGSIWRKRADGLGPTQLLLESENEIRNTLISPDGLWIVYRELPSSQTGVIYAVDVEQDNEPIALVNNGFEVTSPALSPDGRWLAYASNSSGQFEIYVQPFPDAENGLWQLSAQGGTEPVWANNGQELFYRNSNEEMIAVKLDIGSTFDWNEQRVLFNTEGYRSANQVAVYDISPDDQHFVMMRLEPPRNTELIMVDNWAEELRLMLQD